jgi:hypothetical protein
MSTLPVIGAETVFFIGNGVLRVPTRISGQSVVTPSWYDYMVDLHKLASSNSNQQSDSLKIGDFLKLPAPRQAEWFDRNFKPNQKLVDWETSALRLHLLGIKLHPIDGLLTNELLERVGKLVCVAAEQGPVDLFTSNLDCSLEQNIATEIEAACAKMGDVSAEITVMAGFRTSVIWQRQSSGPVRFKVRIWKIHGCLRDLKLSITDVEWAKFKSILSPFADYGAATSDFCGHIVPNVLTPTLPNWLMSMGPGTPAKRPFCIFSISEYFQSLAHIVQLGNAVKGRVFYDDECREFANFIGMMKSRPLIILGYSLMEEDIDIIYLLQTYGSTASRKILMPERGWGDSQEARLTQMGISSLRYSVDAQGFSLPPGCLRLTARHEWRTHQATEWTSAIQKLVADASAERGTTFLQTTSGPSCFRGTSFHLARHFLGTRKRLSVTPPRFSSIYCRGLSGTWWVWSRALHGGCRDGRS